MPRFLSLATRLLLPLLLVASAQAEGLVQLSLRGRINTRGGAPVELNIGFWDGKRVRAVDLRLHLAEGTSASDLATLLATRLRKAHAELVTPEVSAASGGSAQLFIESATLVSLRLGHGLSAIITTADSVPEAVRFQVPKELEQAAKVSISVTTFHPHTKLPSRVDLVQSPEADTSPSSICESFFNEALEKGLICDRPNANRWRPMKTSAGAMVTGCSIDLRSEADWGLEVQLAVPRKL